ncbi:VirB4 family type IV secretion system protein [Anaerotignum sp.]|uniref:VirB4 family type IV secretion system protein n=1 Tax=Anaerotignum sp. TaxID=2039241 RepID=UPI0028B0A1E1|nr:ATP-binding protein [Anaerotignum sp.]
MSKSNEHDSYIIPPNFIDSGSFFGGMFKARNTIEAGVLLFAMGIPGFTLGVSLTAKIIILCLTALPLALFALIGIGGESLSSFALIFFRYLRNRRVVGVQIEEPKTETAAHLPKRKTPRKKTKKQRQEDFPAEFDEVGRYSRRQKVLGKFPRKEDSPHRGKAKKADKQPEPPTFLNPVARYIPIEKVENGIIYTKDRRFIKILEVEPINFLLRSAREQRNIIYSFISFLKISPVKMQFKVLTKRADINRHLDTVRSELAQETDEGCRMLQEDYLRLVKQIGSKEAITRRFFIIFEYEPCTSMKRGNEESEAIAALSTAAHTAENYLRQCGNRVITPEDENEFAVDVLYNVLRRSTSCDKSLSTRAKEIAAKYVAAGRTEDLDSIPASEFCAPDSIDFMHGQYVKIDDVYHSYLLVPSDGFRSHVPAGWLSLIVNAGDGIDMDVFLARQPKERIIQKLGQQLRINRSKIKETSDTNTDFDDLDGAIRSGYFLKEGLGNNEDFYYLNLLITVTANTVDELEWRLSEMKKLLLSQDMNVSTCSFREEQAFLSALPLVSLEKKLYERSKRNVLTLGAASCYPFTSYEMCDDNGILLGVNKHNNSLIIVDIFNSRTYKNANMAILGTSGAGKTFTLQLMALRMRRKGIQVFILAPLKGHELHRACTNIGGEFIQISPASRNCINIMEIRRADKSVDELLDGPSIEKSELAAKIQKLHIFFSLLIPDMNHEEKQLLDDALIKTYATKGITHDNATLEDESNFENPGSYKEMPILGDLYEVLKLSPDTKRLANILNRLVHGSASTFNQQTNVSLDNKYTVLDISELTGDLLTVGMFVALDYVWDKAKENRTQEKAIFIDECWQLIGGSSNRLAADFVLEIFKIIRGYGGSAVCASQDLNDFFALDDGKYGKGIINNSKTKIILNLEDDEAQRVQQFMNLSEAEVIEITHFERGSGLISTNNNNITVEFKCSQLEKDLITTDRRELQELVERTKQQNEELPI